MSLQDYTVDRDLFQLETDTWGDVKVTEGLSFPCLACKYAVQVNNCGKECKLCQHNINLWGR
jgi:hypothetical protein